MVGMRYPDLNCSLSLSLYNDPVMTCDGFVYERACIEHYWSTTGHIRSPLTNLELENFSLRPAIIVKGFVEKFLSEYIESGKAAALVGCDISFNARKAKEIENVIAQISAQPKAPAEVLILTLLRLVDNVYLRDFASRCGALSIAAIYFANNKSAIATELLMRMIAFSLENQQQVQFIACEAEAAVFSDDVELQTRGFHVLAALIADGGTLQNGLEMHLDALIKPIVRNLKNVPASLCKGILVFAVHLLRHRRAYTSKLVYEADVHVLAMFVLDHMMTDNEAVTLVCWFFSLLSDLPNELKKTFQNMPALEIKLYTAVTTCGSFGLAALTVLVGPRRSVMRAVEVLTDPVSDPRARAAAFNVMTAATMHDTRDQAEFGRRPLIIDVVEYICRSMRAVLDALNSENDSYTLKQGLRLLKNIVCAIDNLETGSISPVPKAIFLQHGVEIVKIMYSSTERIVMDISNNSHPPALNPMDVEMHASCAEVFGFFRHFIRLLADDDFSNVMSQAKVNVVGACIDVLLFAKAKTSEISLQLPEPQDVIRDMVSDALGILETWCTRIEYRELGHAHILTPMVDLVVYSADRFTRFASMRVLETLHALVCSQEAPVHFCMLRGGSATNHAFRREIVRDKIHVKLLNMLASKRGTRQQDLAVLALLRDTVAEIRTHSRAAKHAKFHARLVPVLLAKIHDSMSCAPGCPLTVMVCTETIANLLVADAVPRLRGSLALWDTMLATLRVFGVQSPRPTYVLEQALRVVVLLVGSRRACWASSPASFCEVSHDPRALQRLLAASPQGAPEALQTVATVLWLVRSRAPELSCTSRWCGFEHLARSHAARCAELVLTLTLLVLGEEPTERVVGACVDGALLEAVFAALGCADSLPHGALLRHALERLLPVLPAALAAQGAAALREAGHASPARAGGKRRPAA